MSSLRGRFLTGNVRAPWDLRGFGAAAEGFPLYEYILDRDDSPMKYLSMSDADFGAIDLDSFSVHARITPTGDAGTVRHVFSQFNTGTDRPWRLYVSASDQIVFQIRNGGGAASAIHTPTVVLGTEYDCYGTYDGTDLKLYIDGAETDSVAKTGNVYDSGLMITLGVRGSVTEGFTGTIHQPAFFSGAFPAVGLLGTKTNPKFIHELSGAHSAFNPDLSVISDYVLANWTDNNSVARQLRA